MLIPAEELKGDIHLDEPFKMVAHNHCGEKAVANRLEVSGDQSVSYIPGMVLVLCTDLLNLIQDLNCCPKVPLDYGESIAKDAVSVLVV